MLSLVSMKKKMPLQKLRACEEDNEIIFTKPNRIVIEVMTRSKDRNELWANWELGLKELFDT